MEVNIVSWTQRPEEIIEEAYLSCRNLHGDISGKKDTRSNVSTEDRIRSIFARKHLGVLEHAHATVRVSGISRTCTHQLVRHRIASYAQLSMRSVSPKNLRTIIPPSIQANEECSELYNLIFKQSRNAYDFLRAKGISKQDARFILPMGIETQITITMNFRSWIHFLKLRTDPTAQWEIREMANKIWGELQGIAPNVFSIEYVKQWE